MALPSYRVYHYRADVQPRDLNTLIAHQLWSSKINRLNDPFEFAALRALHAYPDKQKQFMNAGVTCFCRSLTNPLLWSHYAASHTGFAIGFDPAHSFFGGDQGIYMRFLHDVRYEDVAPNLDTFSVDELAMAAVLTKPTCWAYEQEARLIKIEADQAFNVPVDAFKEVVLGAQMGPDRADAAIEAIRKSGLKVRIGRMKYLDVGYGVKPEWISQ